MIASAAPRELDGTTSLSDLGVHLGIGGVALMSDRSVVTSGSLAGSDRHLFALASAARHLFRQTQPALQWIQLEFGHAAVAMLPVGDHVLVLRSETALTPTVVFAAVAVHHDALHAMAAALAIERAVEVASKASGGPGDFAAHSLEALNLLVRAARVELGGPVVRNYLRKTRTSVADPSLEPYDVALDGSVTLATGAATALPRALGTWAEATRVRASTVYLDLGRTTLRAITAPLATQLAGSGFYPDEP